MNPPHLRLDRVFITQLVSVVRAWSALVWIRARSPPGAHSDRPPVTIWLALRRLASTVSAALEIGSRLHLDVGFGLHVVASFVQMRSYYVAGCSISRQPGPRCSNGRLPETSVSSFHVGPSLHGNPPVVRFCAVKPSPRPTKNPDVPPWRSFAASSRPPSVSCFRLAFGPPSLRYAPERRPRAHLHVDRRPARRCGLLVLTRAGPEFVYGFLNPPHLRLLRVYITPSDGRGGFSRPRFTRTTSPSTARLDVRLALDAVTPFQMRH